MKDFCEVAVKVKNDLARKEVIAGSVPEKCPLSPAAWNTEDVLKFTAASQAQEDIFSSNWTWHIWFSYRHCFSGWHFYVCVCVCVLNVIETGLTNIYKARSFFQQTSWGLSTAWERMQFDITGGVQDALWHPALHSTSSSTRTSEAAGCTAVSNHQDPHV